MRFGFDYGGYIAPATLRSLGVTFVCRYLRELGGQEVRDLHAAGIDVVLIHEYAADTIRTGSFNTSQLNDLKKFGIDPGRSPRKPFDVGVIDAKLNIAQMNALGAPSTAVPYPTADWDATGGDQASINAYLDGRASLLGNRGRALYGGYWPLMRAFNAGKLTWGWATYAWSGKNFDQRCCLYQYKNNVWIAGLNVDYNHAYPAYFGQWAAQTQPTPPEDTVAITSVANADGRLEVFVEKTDGSIWHAWQKTPGGSWEGSAPGVTAQWFSLGKP